MVELDRNNSMLGTPSAFASQLKEYMQQVSGIGGLFFRAKNPAMIAEWYKANLGVALVPADYSQKPWSQEAGPTVFAPFPYDSDYFGNAGKSWMINFRVRD